LIRAYDLTDGYAGPGSEGTLTRFDCEAANSLDGKGIAKEQAINTLGFERYRLPSRKQYLATNEEPAGWIEDAPYRTPRVGRVSVTAFTMGICTYPCLAGEDLLGIRGYTEVSDHGPDMSFITYPWVACMYTDRHNWMQRSLYVHSGLREDVEVDAIGALGRAYPARRGRATAIRVIARHDARTSALQMALSRQSVGLSPSECGEVVSQQDCLGARLEAGRKGMKSFGHILDEVD
jgi:hypothetical protein